MLKMFTAAAAALFALTRSSRGTGLSDPPDHHGDPVRRRRTDRTRSAASSPPG